MADGTTKRIGVVICVSGRLFFMASPEAPRTVLTLGRPAEDIRGLVINEQAKAEHNPDQVDGHMRLHAETE